MRHGDLNGKDVQKGEDRRVHVADSFCRTGEMNTF